MRDYQNPQKEHSRFSDPVNRRSKETQLKKPLKVSRKSLNGALTVLEDALSETSKESSDYSLISEISDASHSCQTTQSSELALNAAVSASSEAFTLSDLTPTSKINASTNGPNNVSMEHYGSDKLGSSKIGTIEADIVQSLLKEAQTQVLNSNDVDHQPKKVLDALINVVIDEYCTLPEQRDYPFDLVSKKVFAVLLSFLLWSFVVSAIFVFGWGLKSSDVGPPPPT